MTNEDLQASLSFNQLPVAADSSASDSTCTTGSPTTSFFIRDIIKEGQPASDTASVGHIGTFVGNATSSKTFEAKDTEDGKNTLQVGCARQKFWLRMKFRQEGNWKEF